MNADLPKLLRAIAGGSDAKANRHDIIFNAAADEIERLQRCHRIVAKQAGYYRPELPDFTKVDIHLGVLRAAERCAGFAPWEVEEEEAALAAGERQ